jgi:mRNA-degrading endonuclease RelE of RelBE toxin-antitoxin system
MTPEEQAKKIEEIYNEAIKKLEELGKQRQEIVSGYVKELEDQKINAIRASLGLIDSNN